MAWILVEGLDRSGKSSVAEYYKKKGYTIVHMEAPSKKYYAEGYAGESYLEELVRLYSKYEGMNVLFDRTVYGELVWPNVYGRQSLLEPEDLDYLGQIERNNSTEKILMYDSNTEAHWQRCVDNNEPLTRQQFGRASLFYDRLAKEYGFKRKQLTDFPEIMPLAQSAPVATKTVESVQRNDGNVSDSKPLNANPELGVAPRRDGTDRSKRAVESLDDRLELANTIREVLQSKILRKKGGAYDDLEKDIKQFLQVKLEEIFVGKQEEKSFSEDEIVILKLYAQRIKEKM